MPMADAATIRMRTMSHPDCRPASRFGRLSGQPGMSRSRALRARALAGRDRRKPYPVIVTSRCDDRVRRSSKSEGGSNPVLLAALIASLAMTGREVGGELTPSLRGALATTASAEARRAKAEAIQSFSLSRGTGLLRCARNDVEGLVRNGSIRSPDEPAVARMRGERRHPGAPRMSRSLSSGAHSRDRWLMRATGRATRDHRFHAQHG